MPLYEKIILKVIFTLSLLGLYGTNHKVKAQSTSFPVSVTTFVNPPFSVFFEDYTSPVANLITTQIRPNEVGRFGYRARLLVTIKSLDGSFSIATRRNFLPARPIILDGGITENLMGVDIAEYFNPNNIYQTD